MKENLYLILDQEGNYHYYHNWKGLTMDISRGYLPLVNEFYTIRRLKCNSMWEMNSHIVNYHRTQSLSAFELHKPVFLTYTDEENDLLIDLYQKGVKVYQSQQMIEINRDMLNDKDVKYILDNYNFKIKIIYNEKAKQKRNTESTGVDKNM